MSLNWFYHTDAENHPMRMFCSYNENWYMCVLVITAALSNIVHISQFTDRLAWVNVVITTSKSNMFLILISQRESWLVVVWCGSFPESVVMCVSIIVVLITHFWDRNLLIGSWIFCCGFWEYVVSIEMNMIRLFSTQTI